MKIKTQRNKVFKFIVFGCKFSFWKLRPSCRPNITSILLNISVNVTCQCFIFAVSATITHDASQHPGVQSCDCTNAPQRCASWLCQHDSKIPRSVSDYPRNHLYAATDSMHYHHDCRLYDWSRLLDRGFGMYYYQDYILQINFIA